MRIDKWIWAVRMVKTRTLATDFCKRGRVKLNDEKAKPAKDIKVGDFVELSDGGQVKKYKVLGFIEKRSSAKVASVCFEDHSPERVFDVPPSFYGKHKKGAGRPTKRNRREIERFKSELL